MQELRDQLADEASPFRTGAFAQFASSILQLSGVLPSQHCLWSPGPETTVEEGGDSIFESLSKLNELVDVAAHSDDEHEEEDVVKRPEYWGLKVKDLSEFHSAIREELEGYCQDHRVCFKQGQCVHLCKHGPSCPWGDHAGVRHEKTHEASENYGQPLLPNMHAALWPHRVSFSTFLNCSCTVVASCFPVCIPKLLTTERCNRECVRGCRHASTAAYLNSQQVVARYVKPQTRLFGTSWATMKRLGVHGQGGVIFGTRGRQPQALSLLVLSAGTVAAAYLRFMRHRTSQLRYPKGHSDANGGRSPRHERPHSRIQGVPRGRVVQSPFCQNSQTKRQLVWVVRSLTSTDRSCNSLVIIRSSGNVTTFCHYEEFGNSDFGRCSACHLQDFASRTS